MTARGQASYSAIREALFGSQYPVGDVKICHRI